MDGKVADLSLKDNPASDIEKRLPGGKVKKKQKLEVVLEVSTRSKKKSVTIIQGSFAEPAPVRHSTYSSYLCSFGICLARELRLGQVD